MFSVQAWKFKVEKISAEMASMQLSVIYGHVIFFIGNKTEAMDSSFNDFVRYLNK